MEHFVNGVDCTGFSHTARPPMTNAKKEMIELTRTDLEGWIVGVRADPEAFCRGSEADQLGVVGGRVRGHRGEIFLVVLHSDDISAKICPVKKSSQKIRKDSP